MTTPDRFRIAGVGVGIAVVVMAVVSLEIILSWTGRNEWDPYGAFFESRVFQPVSNHPEILCSNQQAGNSVRENCFNKVKPDNTVRIFALGGSSTFGWGLPAERAFPSLFATSFASTLPESRVEMINAGAVGYGSHRVALLAEEIMNYQPDLILVYCGHNEFWEYPVYRQLRGEEWGWIRFSFVLSRSRGLRQLQTVAESLNWPAPLRNVYGAYERVSDEQYADIVRRYGENLQRIIEASRIANARVVFATLPANLRVDIHSDLDLMDLAASHRSSESAKTSDVNRLLDAAESQLDERHPVDALRLLVDAERLNGKTPWLHGLRGRAFEMLGQTSNATSAYWKQLHYVRRLATQEVNDELVRIASEFDVQITNAVTAFEDHSDSGIPGYDLFFDSMHPNQRGHQIVADEFLRTIQRGGSKLSFVGS